MPLTLPPDEIAVYEAAWTEARDAIDAAKAAGMSGPDLHLKFCIEMQAAAGRLYTYQDEKARKNQPELAAEWSKQMDSHRDKAVRDIRTAKLHRALDAVDSRHNALIARIRAEKQKARATFAAQA